MYPSTTIASGQASVEVGVSPCRSIARPLTVLNVEPGSYRACVAVEATPAEPGPDATASSAPSEGRTATSAEAGVTEPSTPSAIVCSEASIVVCTSAPSTATTRCRSRAWLPCVCTAWIT